MTPIDTAPITAALNAAHAAEARARGAWAATILALAGLALCVALVAAHDLAGEASRALAERRQETP